MYIRYFFIYRLWRKINENVAVKDQITAAAIASLGPLPSTFSSSILEDVLPKVPKSQPNSTKALLQHKFDIKKHCEMFAQYCRKSNGSVYQDGIATPIDSSSRINSKMVFIYILIVSFHAHLLYSIDTFIIINHHFQIASKIIYYVLQTILITA